MGGKISKKMIESSESIDNMTLPLTNAVSTEQSENNGTPRRRILQNFRLIWLDCNIDEFSDEYRNSIVHLRKIVNAIDLFTDIDRCATFLNQIKDERSFIIISNALGKNLVPIIHNLPQVDSIFIFCEDDEHSESWTTEWSKIKGVFTDILSICHPLQQAARKCDQNLPM